MKREISKVQERIILDLTGDGIEKGGFGSSQRGLMVERGHRDVPEAVDEDEEDLLLTGRFQCHCCGGVEVEGSKKGNKFFCLSFFVELFPSLFLIFIFTHISIEERRERRGNRGIEENLPILINRNF